MSIRAMIRQWLWIDTLATRRDVAALLGEVRDLRSQQAILLKTQHEELQGKLENLCTLIQMAQLTRPSPIVASYDWEMVQAMALEELQRNPKEEN